MKKTLLGLLACSAVFFTLMSCNDPNPGHVAEVVDLRNKEGSTVSNFRSALSREAANTEFSAEMINEIDHFIGENGPEKMYSKWVSGKDKLNFSYTYNDSEFAKMKDAVKLSDDDNGVKFTITKPEGYTQDFTWINIHYLDDVGHKSTALDTAANNMDLSGKEKVELVYPLVDKTKKETRFWIQICTDDYEAQLMYKVKAIHGYGCVDSVQSDFSMRDYLEITDENILTLKLTIPPVAKKDTLKHNIGFKFQTSSKPQYSEEAWNDGNEIADLQKEVADEILSKLNIIEPASEKEITAATNGEVVDFKIDLNEHIKKFSAEEKTEIAKQTENYPYFWASFIYSYKIKDVEGLEDYIFTTPWVVSNVIENPFINN